VIWKAAAEAEKLDIKKTIGERAKIFVAPNMPPRTILENFTLEMKPLKEKGAVRLIFLSRVSPKKNLRFALELLQNLKGEVIFDLYGSLEDEAYWKECQEIITALPSNIKVEFRGSVEYERVAEKMSGYHFFFFPTLGENFGHVVIEALAAGCPVLISDQTPWRNLENASAGWDIPLSQRDKWTEILTKCVEMSHEEFIGTAGSARKFAEDWLAAPEIEQSNRRVLREAAGMLKN
jgi:glycosyltransferase involved in cell wall biosynthesis